MDGKGHLAVWKISLVPVMATTLGVGLSTGDVFYPAGAAAGYLLGLFIDPDLDLVGSSDAEKRLMRVFKLFGALVVGWFFVYAYLMRFIGVGKRGHRSFLSHFPGISTAIRLLWLLLIPGIIMASLKVSVPPVAVPIGTGVWIGLSVADTLHYLGDQTVIQKLIGYRRKNV